jgi:hypothetical protein
VNVNSHLRMGRRTGDEEYPREDECLKRRSHDKHQCKA